MPYSDLNLGKVVLGYMPHCWFDRPLLLSNAVIRSPAKDQLVRAIDSELALGCDGFVLCLGAKLSGASFAEQVAFFDEIVTSYSHKAFIYFEVRAQGIESHLLDLLRRHTFPNGYTIASTSPGTLRELYRLDPDFPLKIALIVGREKEFSGLRHCPYTTVEITDALATHEQILGIHNSGKAVFIRATFGKAGGAANEKEVGKIEKRVRWLMHEGADAIISDRVDLLSSIIGSKRTNAGRCCINEGEWTSPAALLTQTA